MKAEKWQSQRNREMWYFLIGFNKIWMYIAFSLDLFNADRLQSIVFCKVQFSSVRIFSSYLSLWKNTLIHAYKYIIPTQVKFYDEGSTNQASLSSGTHLNLIECIYFHFALVNKRRKEKKKNNIEIIKFIYLIYIYICY